MQPASSYYYIHGEMPEVLQDTVVVATMVMVTMRGRWSLISVGVAQPVRYFIGSKSARARLVARVGVPFGRH